MTDSADADLAAPDRPHRRALLGAGVLAAALAITGSKPTAATGPTGLSEDDLENIAFLISVELAARDLYDAAIAAGARGEVWAVMREQHEAYAQLLAGISGISADSRNEAAYELYESGFVGRTSAAAFEVENVSAATQIDLLGAVVDVGAAEAMASIAAMESRHAVVMAELAGIDDFDALFLNNATPLSPEA